MCISFLYCIERAFYFLCHYIYIMTTEGHEVIASDSIPVLINLGFQTESFYFVPNHITAKSYLNRNIAKRMNDSLKSIVLL